ncbi:MAG: tetratricopeptide repeat protein [Gammaproteobacteria bacterium]|nr:tetratricopeptide repeat protein [Gammaproteobacteria bacterium]
MKNFIEVGKTEEEQAEQIKKWIKENAPQIVIGISLGLGGIWGFDYYKNQQHQQAIQARGHYLSVTANPNNIKALNTLKEEHAESAYTQQVNFVMAKQAMSKGNYQAALDYLSPLVGNENEFIAQNAKLRAVSVHLEIGNTDKALKVLGDNSNKAFSALYDNAKGDIYFAKNDFSAAKKHYQLALAQLSDESRMRSLIQIKLNDIN